MNNYSTTLKTRGFLYLETKKAAALLLDGLTAAEIKKKSMEENIFLMKTDNRKQEVASTILNRLSTIDDHLLKVIVNGDLGTSKLVVFLAIIKSDRLFFEFMREVFNEKLLLKNNTITILDFNNFFQRKSEQSDQIARWADYTYYKLGQVYRKILTEAGLAKPEKGKLRIYRAVLNQDVVAHIKTSGDQLYLNTMTGGA